MPVSDFGANVMNDALATKALYVGAIKSTTLTAAANAAQAQASLTHAVGVGDILRFQGTTPEIKTVLSVTGAGPYVATMDSNFASTFASGSLVGHEPKEGATVREPSGGSPAYARKSATWSSSASRDLDMSNVPVLDIPASTQVGALGFWDAVTAGNYCGSGLGANVIDTGASQGTIQANDADVILGV